MKRELLIIERLKTNLGITHLGCKSSFSSVISTELSTRRKNKLITDEILKQQFECDRALQERVSVTSSTSDLRSYHYTSTFMSALPLYNNSCIESITTSMSSDIENVPTSRYSNTLNDIDKKTLTYQQYLELMRHQYSDNRLQMLQLQSSNGDNADETAS